MRNEVMRERIRRTSKAGSWTCRLFSLPGNSIGAEGTPDDRTFWMLAALDESDCVVLTVTADEKEPVEELEEALAEGILAERRCPEIMNADSRACMSLLRGFCMETGIELTQLPEETGSDGCGVMELLSTAPDTVTTIHDSFCEILLQLRDEELLRMPGDLVETMIRMEGKGTVPHVLAVRMRRLFGVTG